MVLFLQVAVKAAPGVWVSSTDMILTIPEHTGKFTFQHGI